MKPSAGRLAGPGRAAVLFVVCVALAIALSAGGSRALPQTQVKQATGPEPALNRYLEFLDRSFSTDRLERDLRNFTSVPHVASSPRNTELARAIRDEWTACGLEDVHLAEYDVLLSFPERILVELVAPARIALSLKEDSYPQDPDTARPDVGLPYNAYSASGEVTAPVVYANSGNPEDYDLLEKRGIDPRGKIALVRYSEPYSYRGFKAQTAERRGLAALLIYSDPKEDGAARGPVFPDGPWGPISHIQRGGIPFDFIYPGDPMTPGWASVPGAKRLPLEKCATVPKIISVPLSARDALPILRAMVADTGAVKKNHACAPLPERDRSTATGTPARLHVSANALTSLAHEHLSKSMARNQQVSFSRSG